MASLGSLSSLGASLLGTIPASPSTTTQFEADGTAMSAQQSDNLANGLLDFQEAVNLISFFSADVLLHLATWTWRFKRP